MLDYLNSLRLDMQVGVESCTNIHLVWLDFIIHLCKPCGYIHCCMGLDKKNLNAFLKKKCYCVYSSNYAKVQKMHRKLELNTYSDL